MTAERTYYWCNALSSGSKVLSLMSSLVKLEGTMGSEGGSRSSGPWEQTLVLLYSTFVALICFYSLRVEIMH